MVRIFFSTICYFFRRINVHLLRCLQKVYLFLEDDGWQRPKYWIAECRPNIVHLVMNDTYLSADYYITDKKFNWLITENHHEIVHIIGIGLDVEVIKDICGS